MQDHLKPKIEEITKKQFPNGIKEYGTDALRYTFASLATTGRDIRFDFGRIEGYKNFCNKLWNASLYVLDNTKNFNNKENLVLNTGDRWIKSKLQHTITSVHQHFSNYRFDLVSQNIYEFTWHEFCDWYIELSKTILQSEHTSIEEKQGTSQTLIETLESILRLLHPIMPFITEEIWLKVANRLGITEKTIMLASYPQSEDTELDLEAEEEMNWVMNFILGIRQIRGEMDIPPGKKLPVLLKQVSKTDQKRIHKHLNLLKQIGRIKNISFLKDNEVEPNSSTALLGNMRILVPLANLIDIEAETTRLEKQKIKIQQELNLSLRKLKNPEFTNNAPAEIIKKEKDRVSKNEKLLKQINEQISKFKDM
jgi:valyl-tRNA synthetase